MTGCRVLTIDHSDEIYDSCVICIHAPDAIKILGTQATYDEIRILGAFQFVNRYFWSPFRLGNFRHHIEAVI